MKSHHPREKPFRFLSSVSGPEKLFLICIIFAIWLRFTPEPKSKSYGNWNQISIALERILGGAARCPFAMSCCHTFHNFYSGSSVCFFVHGFVSVTVWKAQIAVDSWPKSPNPLKNCCHVQRERRKRNVSLAHTLGGKVQEPREREKEMKGPKTDRFRFTNSRNNNSGTLENQYIYRSKKKEIFKPDFS